MEIWDPKFSWNTLGHNGTVTGLLYIFYMSLHPKRSGKKLD